MASLKLFCCSQFTRTWAPVAFSPNIQTLGAYGASLELSSSCCCWVRVVWLWLPHLWLKQVLSLLPSLHLLCLRILYLAWLDYKSAKRSIKLAWQTIFRRAPSLLGCQSSFVFSKASSLVPLPCKIHSTPLAFTSVMPRVCFFFPSWHNLLSLLLYLSYFPFSVLIRPSFTCDCVNMFLVAYQFWKTSSVPPLCALPSVSPSRTPSPGSSLVPAETQKVSGNTQNRSIIQVISRDFTLKVTSQFVGHLPQRMVLNISSWVAAPSWSAISEHCLSDTARCYQGRVWSVAELPLLEHLSPDCR